MITTQIPITKLQVTTFFLCPSFRYHLLQISTVIRAEQYMRERNSEVKAITDERKAMIYLKVKVVTFQGH
jgi:hypothetical protein